MSDPGPQMLSAMAQLLLQKPSGSVDHRWGLADRCRGAGEIGAARALLDVEGLPPQAQALRCALSGTPWRREVAPGYGVPEPIRLIDDWLPSEELQAILTLVRARIPQLTSSQVYDGDYSGVDLTRRRSLVLEDTREIADIFLPRLRTLMPRASEEFLGVPDINLQRIELQATQHGDGAFFKPHSDAGRHADSRRKISYVFYFAFPEVEFDGGDLRIFDGDPISGAWSSSSFTTIKPVPNRIVMFPSLATHEVTAVRSSSRNPLAGRFSLNGWLH